jgi:Uncharacterized protein related to arylsulfate sulfotransferase involved in siderophore biosynthesis
MTRPGPAGIVKRSLVIAGHSTSVSLEEPFWAALKEMAAARGVSVAQAVAAIDEARGEQNLSSAIRVAVLDYVRAAARG